MGYKSINSEPRPALFTHNYITILVANFLFALAFYLMLAVMPLYLRDEFFAQGSIIGLILSCYTATTMLIRPFAGYLLDTFQRKPLYVLSYFLFLILMGGYMVAGTLVIIALIRALHGVAFGIATVSGNTVVIDIMPSRRRGEGLGYYGLMSNLAMAVGPALGLWLLKEYSYITVFGAGVIAGLAGWLLTLTLKVSRREKVQRQAVSLDRFVLKEGIPAGVSLICLSIPYGTIFSYIVIYAEELGIGLSQYIFFMLISIGMIASRLFSGRLVDRGYVTQIIVGGISTVIVAFAMLAGCKAMQLNDLTGVEVVFFASALLIGIGFGTMFPAFNSLFVNLAEHNRRGTATSTYLTSWDLGIGVGLVLGGVVAQYMSFSIAYVVGALLGIIALFYFIYYVTPHYNKHKKCRD